MSSHNDSAENWVLQFYAKDLDERSRTEFAKVKYVCDEHLPGEYSLEFINVSENPYASELEAVMFLPMLVQLEPKPRRRIICDFTDVDEILEALGLKVASEMP